VRQKALANREITSTGSDLARRVFESESRLRLSRLDEDLWQTECKPLVEPVWAKWQHAGEERQRAELEAVLRRAVREGAFRYQSGHAERAEQARLVNEAASRERQERTRRIEVPWLKRD
jgi:hypothetical protein